MSVYLNEQFQKIRKLENLGKVGFVRVIGRSEIVKITNSKSDKNGHFAVMKIKKNEICLKFRIIQPMSHGDATIKNPVL